MTDQPAAEAANENTTRRKRRRRARMRAVILIAVLGVSVNGTLFAGRYTVVRTDKETFAFKTGEFGFEQAYVDVRKWGPADYDGYPNIARALIDRGYEHPEPTRGPQAAVQAAVGPARRPQKPLEPAGHRLDRIFGKERQQSK